MASEKLTEFGMHAQFFVVLRIILPLPPPHWAKYTNKSQGAYMQLYVLVFVHLDVANCYSSELRPQEIEMKARETNLAKVYWNSLCSWQHCLLFQ